MITAHSLPYLFDLAPVDLESGRLLSFHHFQQIVSLFARKECMITKSEDVPKQNLNYTLKVSLRY